jgi:hypothetical protein
MEAALDLARTYLDRRTALAFLGTVGARARPETCILVAPRLGADGTLSGGEEEGASGAAFRNLRQNPNASVLVLDPVADPRARDGVRMTLEFLGAETDGEELARMDAWLSGFAPGRRVVRRLLFKVIGVDRYREPKAPQPPQSATPQPANL